LNWSYVCWLSGLMPGRPTKPLTAIVVLASWTATDSVVYLSKWSNLIHFSAATTSFLVAFGLIIFSEPPVSVPYGPPSCGSAPAPKSAGLIPNVLQAHCDTHRR